MREPTDRLVLNAVGLTFGEASIDDAGISAHIILAREAEIATLIFPHILTAGPHKLRITFTAQINKFGRGLFFVDYPTDRARRRMISSHLEPADARRIFPCWDEPAFKATFALTVTLPRDFLAVSNMPVAREEPVTPDAEAGRFATDAEDVELPLRACGRRARAPHRPVDGVTVNVITTAGKRASGQFALDKRDRSAALLQRLFRRQYPLPSST